MRENSQSSTRAAPAGRAVRLPDGVVLLIHILLSTDRFNPPRWSAQDGTRWVHRRWRPPRAADALRTRMW
jgi:hypothetical protein